MKKLLVSEETGDIVLTTAKELSDGKYITIGQKEDFTDETLRAAFEWFIFKLKEKDEKNYHIKRKGLPYVLEIREEE